MRILLVEDDESIREVFKLMLESESPFSEVIVDTAGNMPEAIERVKSSSPDVVLLDLTLSDEHGFSVFRELRSLKECQNLAVIAVTAHAQADLEKEAKELGFAGYVTKPIDFDRSLYPLMKRILQERSTHAA